MADNPWDSDPVVGEKPPWESDPVVTQQAETPPEVRAGLAQLQLTPEGSPGYEEAVKRPDVQAALTYLRPPEEEAGSVLGHLERVPPQQGPVMQTLGGLSNVAATAVEQLTTPANLALLPATAVRGIGRVAGLLFGAQALQDVPEAARETIAPDKTLQERIESGGRAVTDLIFGGLGVGHGTGALDLLGRAKSVPERVQAPVEAPLVEPKTSLGETPTPQEVVTPSGQAEIPAVEPQPERTGEITDASKITEPTSIPSEQVRPAVDEGTPLRQQGETPQARQEVVPTQEEVAPAAAVPPTERADYRGEHGAPDRDTGSPLHNLTENGTYPDDIYRSEGLRYYATGEDVLDRQTHSTIQSLKNKPNATVTIYRAVPYEKTTTEKIQRYEDQKREILRRGKIPTDADQGDWKNSSAYYEHANQQIAKLQSQSTQSETAPPEINAGDWVTISRQYAKDHGESALNGNYKIVSKKVKASEIFTNGDSWLEWGYDPKTKPVSSPTTESVASPQPKSEVAAAVQPPEQPSITSIKNEIVDKEREARDLPSVIEPARKGFGDVWDEAARKIDENPNYPDEIVAQLESKPRALTDVEDAAILHRQIDLQNQYSKSANALLKARESGDETAITEQSARANALSDQLLQIYDVGKSGGRETGRGLNARKLLAAEDYSLANMITQKRVANQGAPLSEKQSAQVEAAHKKITAAQTAYDAYETSPKAEAYRKRLRTLTEQYRTRTEQGDFAPRTTKPILPDKDLIQRKANLERAKQEFWTALAKDRAANRTPSQKFWDRFVGVERAFKLSSDVVLAKLTTAAAVREGVLTPAEEVVGGVLSKALPRLAARAPREGGFSPAAEIQAKVQMFTQGMKDSWANLRMKQTDLDTLYKTGKIKAPDEFYDYLGYLHGALKAPIKRAEFARSLTKRMEWAIRDGRDPNNMNTMRELSEEAYVDANRSIFLQDNIVSKGFTLLNNYLETNKIAPNMGPALARLNRFLVPIVKVGTNIVGEVMTGIHGTATGSYGAAKAYLKGVDSLPTEQADLIMRQLKKGLIGNALILTGYLGYKSIGGFYHDQDKRKEGDVKPGRYRVGEVDIPASAGHSTAAMLLNIGATLHRVADEQAKKTSPETKGKAEAVRATAAGLAHEVPFVPAVTGIVEALDTKGGLQKYINNMITSTASPALLSHVAKVIDTPGTFPQNILEEPVKRKPQTPVQAIEMGVPGLRQRVPERVERTKKPKAPNFE